MCESAGVFAVGLEGMMLMGAFAAATGAWASGSALAGVALSLLGGAAMGGVLALVAVRGRADAMVTGLTANIFAAGLASYGLRALGGDGRGVAIHLTPLPPWPIPGLADLPGLGPLLFALPPLTYLGLALTGGLDLFLSRTQAGLVLRATGENPDAVFAAGADPLKVRMLAVVAGGAVAMVGCMSACGSGHTISPSSWPIGDSTALPYRAGALPYQTDEDGYLIVVQQGGGGTPSTLWVLGYTTRQSATSWTAYGGDRYPLDVAYTGPTDTGVSTSGAPMRAFSPRPDEFIGGLIAHVVDGEFPRSTTCTASQWPLPGGGQGEITASPCLPGGGQDTASRGLRGGRVVGRRARHDSSAQELWRGRRRQRRRTRHLLRQAADGHRRRAGGQS